MKIVRKSLPADIAAVLFCTKQVVVVDKSLGEAMTLAAVAFAVERCNGLIAIVMMPEVRRAVRLTAQLAWAI